MKQLIKIKATFLKPGDLIFDYRYRDCQKVEYISIEDEKNRPEHTQVCFVPHTVHISYGLEADSADNFSADSEVTILIDTENIKTVKPENIGYR